MFFNFNVKKTLISSSTFMHQSIVSHCIWFMYSMSLTEQLFLVHCGWEKCSKMWLVKYENWISRSWLQHNFSLFIPSCVHAVSVSVLCLSPSPPISISHPPFLPPSLLLQRSGVRGFTLIYWFVFLSHCRCAQPHRVPVFHTHTHTPANPALYGVGKPPLSNLLKVWTPSIWHLSLSPPLFFVFSSLIRPACSSWA